VTFRAALLEPDWAATAARGGHAAGTESMQTSARNGTDFERLATCAKGC
jgi:hypothetical protein